MTATYIDDVLDRHEYRVFVTKVDDTVLFSIPVRVIPPIPKFTTITYIVMDDGIELCFYDQNNVMVHNMTVVCSDALKVCIIITTMFLVRRVIRYDTDYVVCSIDNNEDNIPFHDFCDAITHEYVDPEEHLKVVHLFTYGCIQAATPNFTNDEHLELNDELSELRKVTETLGQLII
jgi:hypothetical protein